MPSGTITAEADVEAAARPASITGGPGVIVDVAAPVGTASWAEVVAGDPDAMADHDHRWFGAMSVRGAWRDASRRYLLDDGSAVVLPLVVRGPARLGCTVAASPPAGCGFGGLVGRRSREPEVVRAVLADVAGLGHLSVRLRPAPETGSTYADVAPAGALAVPRRAHVLDLSPGLDDAFAAMRKSTRRAVRRHRDGKGGFRVEEAWGTTHLAAYRALRDRSVERWAQASREPLALARRRADRGDPDRALEDLARGLGERFRTWVAWADGEPAAVNVMATGPTAHVLRAAMDERLVGSTGLMQYLDWLTIERAHEAGAHRLNLGESGTSEALGFYKEGLGAVALDYAEVRFERLPVTPVDAAARRVVKRVIGFRDPA